VYLSLGRRPVCTEGFNKKYRVLTSISFHSFKKFVEFPIYFEKQFFLDFLAKNFNSSRLRRELGENIWTGERGENFKVKIFISYTFIKYW